MNVLNKLAFVPGKPFHPPSLWVIPGAYSRVERLKGVSHGLATASPTNYTISERLARRKRFSLLRKFVTCGRKSFKTLAVGFISLGLGKH
jgi:hypothetical protein